MLHRAAIRRRTIPLVLAVLVGASFLNAQPAEAAAPAFGLVHGDGIDGRIVLAGDESFAFQFGTIIDDVPEGLEPRGFLEFGFFWLEPWVSFIRDGGDPKSVAIAEANQRARLYFGTESEPPIFVYLNRNPAGWPVKEAEFHRYVGPHPLAILASHGVPITMTDPHGRARVQDDPPAVTSGGEQILPVQLPSAGSGGLGDEGRRGGDGWMWASVGAGVVVIVGAGLQWSRRKVRRR